MAAGRSPRRAASWSASSSPTSGSTGWQPERRRCRLRPRAAASCATPTSCSTCRGSACWRCARTIAARASPSTRWWPCPWRAGRTRARCWPQGTTSSPIRAPAPTARHLAWLSWDHPDMPWDRTTLWLAELDGARAARRAGADRDGAGGEPGPAGMVAGRAAPRHVRPQRLLEPLPRRGPGPGPGGAAGGRARRPALAAGRALVRFSRRAHRARDRHRAGPLAAGRPRPRDRRATRPWTCPSSSMPASAVPAAGPSPRRCRTTAPPPSA